MEGPLFPVVPRLLCFVRAFADSFRRKSTHISTAKCFFGNVSILLHLESSPPNSRVLLVGSPPRGVVAPAGRAALGSMSGS